MEIEILEQDKVHAVFTINNMTVAEILRVYLSEAGAAFAAWRREHPSRPLIMRIEHDKGVSKVVSAAVHALTKECEQLRSLVKK